MLQPTLLLMLHSGPAHAYEMLERLKSFSINDIDPSLIYRAMHVLEADGLVTSTWDDKDSQGPPRRVYELTHVGDAMLKDYLDDLRKTRARIDHLIQTYEQHMREENGEFHNDKNKKEQ
jgi:DNA-binding PadR family transcriptional regulator